MGVGGNEKVKGFCCIGRQLAGPEQQTANKEHNKCVACVKAHRSHVTGSRETQQFHLQNCLGAGVS